MIENFINRARYASIKASKLEETALKRNDAKFSRQNEESDLSTKLSKFGLKIKTMRLPQIGQADHLCPLVIKALDLDTRIIIPEGLSIITDPTLLGRAIGNLIRNASIHAGHQAKVSIVAIEAQDSVSITITDNGPGVPKDELDRIFEPFYRIDRSRSRDSGGSGLGLAIVRSAIQSCGGEAVALLPEAGGFAVTLRLPKQARGPL